MKKILFKNFLLVLLAITMAVVLGCGKKDKEKEEAPLASAPATQLNNQAGQAVVAEKPVVSPDWLGAAPAQPPEDAVLSVDGVILKKSQLDKQTQIKMKLFKDRIPADKKKEAQAGIRKQLKEEFIMRMLLNKEIESRKITATRQEIDAELAHIKASLPPDKKVEDFLKENQISRQDIAFGIKIKKLVEKEAGSRAKPSAKEISKFYNDNKEKFRTQETVHARHILTIIDPEDDEKTKAEKKAKIEGLRKQIVEGADFTEVAKNNSDCPSKENGGDLGEIKKGQTVKPFEDAAFSQEIKAIGPVVTTEFGHHIVQVLERRPGSITRLEEVRDKIAKFLEQQKQAEIFAKMTKELVQKAAIIDYER